MRRAPPGIREKSGPFARRVRMRTRAGIRCGSFFGWGRRRIELGEFDLGIGAEGLKGFVAVKIFRDYLRIDHVAMEDAGWRQKPVARLHVIYGALIADCMTVLCVLGPLFYT